MDSSATPTPKRSASPLDASDLPDSKKTRFSSTSGTSTPLTPDPATLAIIIDEDDDAATLSTALTQHHLTRQAIQRSIALVLDHDGFGSATPEAIESFTELVETYLESIIEETTSFAIASRRDHPIPVDFECMLRRHNLPIASLKPHLKQPLPLSKIAPTWNTDILPNDDALTTLPLLSEELSGQRDRQVMHHIPSSFPDFPSRHTYRFTPQEDTSTRDSQKIREEAARTAQQGEDALRRLVRASKMRKQKEIKTLVQRDSQGKERFRLWEATMRRFMAGDRRSTADPAADQLEIADHSMIVNSDAMFARKEVSRFGKRTAAAAATAAAAGKHRVPSL